MSVIRYQHETLVPPQRILVTGDTHLGPRRDWLPERLLESAGEADAIIHTGDFSTLDAFERLSQIAPLLAVAGNNDEHELWNRLPECIRLSVGSIDALVAHGHRAKGTSARAAVRKAYAGDHDLVVYGHSHRPDWEEVEGTWFLNPGSPTAKRCESHFSYAVLSIDSECRFDVSFCYFDEARRRERG